MSRSVQTAAIPEGAQPPAKDKQNAYAQFDCSPMVSLGGGLYPAPATTASKDAVPMKVFVVEDHPAVRQGIIETINRDGGLTVCGEAEDVQPALAAIEAAMPQLVLVDIQLKSSSGLDLIRVLHERFPALPVIAMTMFDPVRYEKQARAAGASAFIVKQEGADKMLEIIHSVLFR
ncbi:MAG TPA: response regulator transcription factor [Methylomirabilota bacterium]|nr:response regulator transcription factor [Methylomirabilota bacterium]